MNKEKVTVNSYFALLYLSLLSSVFMYLSFSNIKISDTDSILRPIVFIGFTLLFSIPTILVYKQWKKTGVNLFSEKSKVLKVVLAFYGIVYFVATLRTLARFDLFASSELFPGSDMTLFMLFFIGICGVVSVVGISAIARAATIFGAIVIAATIFVSVSLLGEVNMMNFTPLFKDGAFKFIEDSFLFTVQASELGTIILFLSEIKGDVKKHIKIWSVMSGVSFAFIMFFVVGSLGAFADTQLFPTYTAVTLANFGLLKRVDALETAIWILCVVEKVSFYILIVTKCVKCCFRKLPAKYICTGVSALLGLIISIVSNDVEKFKFVSFQPLVISLYLIPVVILPVIILVCLKKVKPREKTEESI